MAFKTAIVTVVTPLTVRLRGSATAVPASKMAHVGTVAVNDVVYCDLADPTPLGRGKQSGSLVVVGKQ